MIPLIRKFFHAILFDELAARRWIVGFIVWSGSVGTNVLAYPWDDVKTWGVGEWGYRLAAAAALSVGVMVATGQKNQNPEQLYEAVHQAKQDRLEAGLEVTDGKGLPVTPKA